ncbi:hypothetical protein JW835_14495 [bacterium]|nr:hypothetical protein [bacterium]
MKHLTDHEIQAWIDGDPGMNRFLIEAHLHQCRECRDCLKSYQTLYTVMETAEKPLNIPVDFADRIMAQLPEKSFKRRHASLWKIIGLFAAATFATGIMIMTSPWTQYFNESSEWAQRLNRIFHAIRISLHWMTNRFYGTMIWLICGICILFCLMTLDKLFSCKWRVHFNTNQ